MNKKIFVAIIFVAFVLLQPTAAEEIQKCYVKIVNSVWEFTANTHDINKDSNFLNVVIYNQGNMSPGLINCRLAEIQKLPLKCIKFKLKFVARGAAFGSLPEEITLSKENNYYFKQRLMQSNDKFFEVKLDVDNGLLKRIHYAFHGSHFGNIGKWQLLCLEKEKPCECKEGACCNGCNFKDSNTKCKSWTEKTCDNNRAITYEYTQFCSGSSEDCSGRTEKKTISVEKCLFMCSDGKCITKQDKNLPVIAKPKKNANVKGEKASDFFGIVGYIISIIVLCLIAAFIFMKIRRR